MRVADLDTPALLVDLDIMERNLRRAAEYAARHGLRLRPHTKTHKIPALGRRQLELGAAGLTVAKVGEAEVMLCAGGKDLLLAYPVVGARKLERLIKVARRTRLTVALDSLAVARPLSAAARAAGVEIGVLAEMDVGLGRVGVSPGQELAGLARELQRLPGLVFEGIAFYPGHIKRLDEDGRQALRRVAVAAKVRGVALRRVGIEPRCVWGGSTPTLFESHTVPGVNEIRPGTYIFNDRNTVLSGACAWEDCAVTILTTVVSTARSGQVIIDGGSKTFSSDRLVHPEENGFGRVVDAPEAVFWNMNEEHGFVRVDRCRKTFRVGDRIRIIPNHVCVAVNLHERIYGIRGDFVEEVWTVDGRGKLQ
ncbi:MAG: alanine racemase [Bryobacteraceae bacterium]|nr:alanine racemase [Bryobacteraceae bacterium]